jgi:muconate cycloisomerase
MKITKIDVHQVVVPARSERVISEAFGPPFFDHAPKLILEVHTDVGLVGLGESQRGSPISVIKRQLSALKDKDLTAINFQDPPVKDFSGDDLFGHNNPDYPHRLEERNFVDPSDLGITVAIMDLIGKRAGLPTHALLGGAYRHRVPADYWMARMHPDASARVCRDAQDTGYRGVKLKCSLEDDNVKRAEAVLKACGPDFKMLFDPNLRFYRPAEAIPLIRDLAKVGNLRAVEDPFDRQNFDWWRQLHDLAICPLAYSAVVFGSSHYLLEAIGRHFCDYINLYGNPWQVKHAGMMCHAAGIHTWHNSGLDLGILEANYLHIAAATKLMSLPQEVLGRTVREHNLITNAFAPDNGYVDVPTGPGLGVELDRDALARYTIKQTTLVPERL